MAYRSELRRVTIVAVVWACSILALEGLGAAQTSALESGEASSGVPWIGCWELIVDPEASEEELRGPRQVVCVEPTGDPRALDLTGRVDDEIVARQSLVADGTRRPVGDAGCNGWKLSVTSADGQRLYLQSDTTCMDGKRRELSGTSMLVAVDRWVDIQALRQGADVKLVIRRYRPLDVDEPHLPASLPPSTQAARMISASPLTAGDVVDALAWVDPLVVEAMLRESADRIAIDSDVLMRLAEARVPDKIIDLMVALSFPDYFMIEGETISRKEEVYYGQSWSPWYPYYGYGHGYFHHYYWHPPVVVPPWNGNGGKVISGRGYTQVRRNQRASGGFAGFVAQAANSGQGGGPNTSSSNTAVNSSPGSATSSGYRNSGSSWGSTRPAVPK